jgi:hypothetical protein
LVEVLTPAGGARPARRRGVRLRWVAEKIGERARGVSLAAAGELSALAAAEPACDPVRSLDLRLCYMEQNIRPVQHLHEIAARDKQGDVAVARGDHKPNVTGSAVGRVAAFPCP